MRCSQLVLQIDEGYQITNTLVKSTATNKYEGLLLPKSATVYYNLILIGLITIVIGVILLIVLRKRKEA